MKLGKAMFWVKFRRIYIPFSIVLIGLLGVFTTLRDDNYADSKITYAQPQCWSICEGNPRDGFTCNPVPRVNLPPAKADNTKAPRN